MNTTLHTTFRKALCTRISLALALTGMVAGPIMSTSAAAQEAAAAQDAITLPENLQIFGKSDPNLRKATAIINGEIVTGTDVDQRVALILAANDNPLSPEDLMRLRAQVLRNLIDETLQIQEAKAQEISVDPAEVEQSYARVAAQSFRQDVKAMDAYLLKIGSAPGSLKRQITGELSWERLMRRNITPFVNVSDDEVNELLARLKAAKGTEEYRIGEIYLSATPEARQQVGENAARIVQQLREGGSFAAYARQFSEASTASVGGDLGWIRLAQLPSELGVAAQQLSPGQLVGPIEVRGGFSILYLADKRQVLTADPRDAIMALKQISIEFPKNVSQPDATRRAGEFATAMKAARGCGTVDAIAAQIGANVVANDQMRVRDLPGPLQEMLLGLAVGEATPPFGSVAEGVRVLMLCGRDDPQANDGPSFDQLMAQIEDDRVNKRAQMYLRDLRRDAVIDYN